MEEFNSIHIDLEKDVRADKKHMETISKEVEDLKEALEEIKDFTEAVRVSVINAPGLDVEERLLLLAYFMGCITGTVDRALEENQKEV